MPDEPEVEEWVEQSFKISMRVKKNPKEGDANEPQWEFAPAGEGIGPTTLYLMLARALEFVALGSLMARQQAAMGKNVPVGGGRNRVIRIQ